MGKLICGLLLKNPRQVKAVDWCDGRWPVGQRRGARKIQTLGRVKRKIFSVIGDWLHVEFKMARYSAQVLAF